HVSGSPLRDDHTFGYDSFGRLTATSSSTTGSETFAYDVHGNVSAARNGIYAYAAGGRLSEVHHNGVLREHAFYDEGRTRVARFDAQTGSLRYYLGGLFEVEGATLVRHYWLGGRIVASDVVPAPDHMRIAASGLSEQLPSSSGVAATD